MGIQIFPKCIDNIYRGNKLAIWLIWPVIIMRAAQGVALIIGGPALLKEADGIPLDTFPIAAANAIFTMFIISATSRILISLIGVIVLMRYRGAFTLFAALLAIDQILRHLVLHYYPIVQIGNPFGPKTGIAFLVLTFAGLALSVSGNDSKQNFK